MSSDLWESVKAKFGLKVPHELKELELSLPDALVRLQLKYDKGRYVDQAVEITFSDTKNVGSVIGKVREEYWITAKKPYFLLSPQYERFYVSQNAEFMKDYMAARKKYNVELENIKRKFDKDQSDAAYDLERAEKEYAKLHKILMAHDEDWEKAGYWDDVKVAGHMEKMDAEDEKIREAREILRSTLPPKIDVAYILEVRTAEIDSISLKQIVEAVGDKKKELLKNLGVLPTTLTEVPVTDTINLVVDWNDS